MKYTKPRTRLYRVRRYFFFLSELREFLGMKGYPEYQSPRDIGKESHEFVMVEVCENKSHEEKKRKYTFTKKELVEKLSLKGTPIQFGLWSGRSPNDEGAGILDDHETWYIDCEEGNLDG